MTGWIFRIVLALTLLGFVGLSGYAYLADIAPQQESVTKPVVLDGQ